MQIILDIAIILLGSLFALYIIYKGMIEAPLWAVKYIGKDYTKEFNFFTSKSLPSHFKKNNLKKL